MTEERSRLLLARSGEIQERALTSLRVVADEYGLPTLRKPCLAYLLDGNAGGAARSSQAYILAVSLRDLGCTESETKRVLTTWAQKIGYNAREACRPIAGAYTKLPGGGYRYHAPGLVKRPGTRAHEVLAAICAEVGCPQNCPAFQDVRRGPRGQEFSYFERLRWPEALRRERHAAAVDYYRAICDLERNRSFAAGAALLTSSRQLAELAGHDPRHALENLRILYTHGLCRTFDRGSGSGPRARDRQPTRVARTVPIPSPPTRLLLPRYRTGGDSPSQIEDATPPLMEGDPRPYIGGGS